MLLWFLSSVGDQYCGVQILKKLKNILRGPLNDKEPYAEI